MIYLDANVVIRLVEGDVCHGVCMTKGRFTQNILGSLAIVLATDYVNVSRKERQLLKAVSTCGGRIGSIPAWPIGTEYRITLNKIPGEASIMFESPEEALNSTRAAWCYDGTSLAVLAISSYHQTSDGNSLGFIRSGRKFRPEVYEFDHVRFRKGADPALWTTKLGDSLAHFLRQYLDQHG